MELIKPFKSAVRRLLGLQGDARRYSQLFPYIRKIKARRIMEVGTWRGTRAVQMIETASKMHPIQEVGYYGFDLFEVMPPEQYQHEISKQPPSQEEVEKKLRATGADIHLFKGNTLQTMPQAVSELPVMDFVFIDGGHSLETIANDWHYTEKLMGPNTIVIFDDYWPSRTDAGAKPTVDGIDTKKFLVEILPIQDRFNNADFGELVINLAKITRRSH